MSEIVLFIGILFVFFISMFTLILSLLLSCIRNIQIRHLLPPVCGIALYFLIVIFPHVIPGFPVFYTSLLPFSPLLILPFFILAPLHYIEQKTMTIFGWLHILFGAAVTTVYFFIVDFFIVVLNRKFFITPKWQAGLPEWTISSVVLAALVFSGIYYLQQYFSLVPEENQEKKDTIRKSSFLNIRTKKIIIIAVWLIVLGSPFFFLGPFVQPTPCTGFGVDMIDQSLTINYTATHLTDSDLLAYPRLGSIIRDSQKNAGSLSAKPYNNRTRLGNVQFSCNEQSQMNMYSGFAAYDDIPRYFEYNGTYYQTGLMWIH